MILGGAIIVAAAIVTTWACTLFFQNATLAWRWFLLANVDVGATLFLIAGMACWSAP